MFASLLQFLLFGVTAILGCMLVLRAWCYACAMTVRDPIVYPIRRMTNWLTDPLSKFLSAKGAWDWPSLVGALLVALIAVLVRVVFHPAGFALISVWIAPFAMVLRWWLEMLTWGIFAWVVISWIAPRHPVRYSLAILMEPFVRPVRRVLPSIRGMDFSPLVVLLVANAVLLIVLPLSEGRIHF